MCYPKAAGWLDPARTAASARARSCPPWPRRASRRRSAGCMTARTARRLWPEHRNECSRRRSHRRRHHRPRRTPRPTGAARMEALSVPVPDPPQVEIVVPVYNEERALGASIRRLHAYLSHGFPFSWRIVVADNASTDSTLPVAHRLAHELPDVAVLHLAEKGRGRALRAAWSAT